MLKRKMYEYLLKWKNKPKEERKPLVIKGARQVGKTKIVTIFGENNYENVVYLDFRQNKSIHKVFKGDFNINDITLLLSTVSPDFKFIPYKTLIIFDEIQDCKNARSSLKYFYLDGRYDVICTGSMLGIKGYNKKNEEDRGIPVGYEEVVEMKSLDFEEFLWANDISDEVILYMKNMLKSKKEIPDLLHEKMLNLYRKYICVGGMPEAVKTYLKTNDMNEVRNIQKQILSDYEDDFGTHLNDDNEIEVDRFAKARILECFRSIPMQLAKENKKFQFTILRNRGSSREYKDAIEWLEDAGIICRCYNLSTLEMPLNMFVNENTFKVYMCDTGLFIAMLDYGVANLVLEGELGIAKGAIYENIVADTFNKNNRKLYYFRKLSGLEIDFVTYINNEITLVEVKANSGNTKSARTILDDENYKYVNKCLKLTSQNIGDNNKIFTMPYYLSFALKE